ncbi:FAD binding domain-containing protein [Puia sp.]|uniref:FAD binding domain-containing protein n=1 Tax=Puia sp. TaxID=2045100 RepID=UPI002F412530
MVKFVLNNKFIRSDDPPATLLLDLIRYREHLTGTKIGCREGDCGACTVLIGELKGDRVVYRSATSCLTAIGNVHNKHVVTIEGINREDGGDLNFLQQAICEEGASQCGFCTPGFLVSMTGFCLNENEPTRAAAIAAVDGNICRCTGYKSIERALAKLTTLLATRTSSDVLEFAISQKILPGYFTSIPRRLAQLALEPNGVLHGVPATDARDSATSNPIFLGGGTDLYVQQPERMVRSHPAFLNIDPSLQQITESAGELRIGGGVTVTQLLESPLIHRAFPHFPHYARLISSTPIRNIATVAGNFVNASPIGDLSVFFLALDARITLSDGSTRRVLPLNKFFKSYKTLDKGPGEYVESVHLATPQPNTRFNFEKVSKRTCLDIASVNTAIQLTVDGDTIRQAHCSAGGVGPIPLYLQKTSQFLAGHQISAALVDAAIDSALTEISPISDVRGTAEYKRLLLGQLIKAHFITLFHHLPEEEWL